MDLSWQLAGSRAAVGGVDTVVLQYSHEQFTSEDANCTLWGVSTAPSAAFKPMWTAKVAHCDVVGPQVANYNNMPSAAITADGATLVASLVVGGVQTLMGWELASGKQLYAAPTPGGSYGVALSGNGQWVLVASDDGNGGRSAFVHSTATGKQRGTSGCRLDWNTAPALSDDGAVIAAGSQNGMTLCAWDAGSSWA
jgi:WD40 repeat protein